MLRKPDSTMRLLTFCLPLGVILGGLSGCVTFDHSEAADPASPAITSTTTVTALPASLAADR
jgi:hypothetical protein